MEKGGDARWRPSSDESVQVAGRSSNGRSRITAVGVVRDGAGQLGQSQTPEAQGTEILSDRK